MSQDAYNFSSVKTWTTLPKRGIKKTYNVQNNWCNYNLVTPFYNMEVRGVRFFILNILRQEVKRLLMTLKGNHVMKCEVMIINICGHQQVLDSIQQ
jgi:hypothetical protein